MTYVVAEPCLTTKDRACVDVCPVSCFYEGTDQLYINPDECVDCDACLPACPVTAIFPLAEVPAEWQHFIKKAEDFFAANPGVQPCKGKGEVGSGGFGPNAVAWPAGAQSPPVAEGGKAAAGPPAAGAPPPKVAAEPPKPAAAPAPAAVAAAVSPAAPPPAPVVAAPVAAPALAAGGPAPSHVEAALSAVEAAVHAARAAAEAAEAAARAMRAAIGGPTPPLAGPGPVPRAPEAKPAPPAPPPVPAPTTPKAATPAAKQSAPAAKPAAVVPAAEKPAGSAKPSAPAVFPQDLYSKGKEVLGRLVQVQTATVPFDPQIIAEAAAIAKEIRGEIAKVMGNEVTSLVELEKKGASWRQAEELARGLLRTVEQTEGHAVTVEKKRRELVESVVGFAGTGAVCLAAGIMAWKSAIELSMAPGSSGSLLDILKAPVSPEGLAPIIGFTIIAGFIAPFTVYAGGKALGRFKELAGLRRTRITALAHLKAVEGSSRA